MATKSLIINSTSQGGKKLQKTMTNINPDCSNEDAGTFAQMANALTTNTYGSAAIVKKMDVNEQDSGGGTPTVTLNTDTSHCVEPYVDEERVETISGGVRIWLGSPAEKPVEGDPEPDEPFDGGYIDVTYTVG